VIEFGDGRRRTVLAYSNPTVDPAGELTGAISVLVDVTEMKRLEHYQRLLEVQLNHARKLEAIGTLAGGVAHEFNNLLTSILGNLQLAEMDLPPGSGLQPYFSEAIDSSRRARELVRRMLTFSHRAEGERRPTRLEPAVRDALSLLRTTLPEHIAITTQLASDCPAVECNTAEIQQAVMQLAVNAAQAMGERGGLIEVSLRCEQLTPSFRIRHPQVAPNHVVCLAVRDDGAGMSSAVLARVGEPFFTTKDPGQGSGLGLAGVYGIMKRHRGALVVESSPRTGTNVRLFFPAADVAPVAATAAGPGERKTQAKFGRVMVVDDDDGILKMATEVLRHRGYEPVVYARPEEALAGFLADPASFALAVTDYVMPGMDGLELARAMFAVRPDLPIVVTSGQMRPEALEEMTNSPSLRFVMKPFDLGALVDLTAWRGLVD